MILQCLVLRGQSQTEKVRIQDYKLIDDMKIEQHIFCIASHKKDMIIDKLLFSVNNEP